MMLRKIQSMQPLFDQVGVALEYAKLIRDLRFAHGESETMTRVIRGLYEIAAHEDWDEDRQIVETLKLGQRPAADRSTPLRSAFQERVLENDELVVRRHLHVDLHHVGA